VDTVSSKAGARLAKLAADADSGGYTLNADVEFCRSLAAGLVTNSERYGIEACPCRIVLGPKEENTDIVCPCDYRDDDLSEYGACFCALYVTDRYDGNRQIPERRPPLNERKETRAAGGTFAGTLAFPVYRCRVCGYLCARKEPPRICPVCKASADRFERFI
jgi:ferredoxin-thioredoxin reductase catalytic subunit/rubredoxin